MDSVGSLRDPSFTIIAGLGSDLPEGEYAGAGLAAGLMPAQGQPWSTSRTPSGRSRK